MSKPNNHENGHDVNDPKSLESEALFSLIVDKYGLDVVVGVLGLRKEIMDKRLRGSVIDHRDAQFTVMPDGIEFVLTDEGGNNWQGELGYDNARQVVNRHIDEQMHSSE